MSQKQKVLDYMRSHGSITQIEATAELGCVRLPSRIWDLKRDGYDIVKTMVTGKNRFGDTISYASYSVKE